MATDQRVEDYVGILNLKYQYCAAVDADDTRRLVDLFTEDATIDSQGMRGKFTGRDEYRSWCENVTSGEVPSAHMAFHPRIQIAGDEAVGHWYYLAILVYDGIAELGQGEYDDEYRRVDGDWRFSSRIAARNMTIDLGPLTEPNAERL